MFSKNFGNMNYHLEMQPLAHAHRYVHMAKIDYTFLTWTLAFNQVKG